MSSVAEWIGKLQGLASKNNELVMGNLGKNLLQEEGTLKANDLAQRKTILAMKKLVKYGQVGSFYKILAEKMNVEPTTLQNQTSKNSMKKLEEEIAQAETELKNFVEERKENSEESP